jgi:hypothetical protein
MCAAVVAAIAFVVGRMSASRIVPAAAAVPAGDPGIALLAEASREQAGAMVRVAELSAQSLRAASGTYVFSLRDRFDERLPTTQLGVASTGWQALGEAPAPLEFLVLHPGDRVRFTLTLVCNQVATDRRVSVKPLSNDPVLHPQPPRFQAAMARSGVGGDFVCPSDVSLFIELCFDVDVADLPTGERFSLPASMRVDTADTRPEGAVARTRIDATILGMAVPDDDGVGLDLLAIEALIGDEERSYYLDKVELLPLSLPGI